MDHSSGLVFRRPQAASHRRAVVYFCSAVLTESFFATLECELLDRTTLSTHAEARAALFEFIEGWYNTRRRHSALGYRSPLEFERLHQAGAVDGARPVDALRAPTSPLDPALRTGSTPPTGINS